MINQIQETNEEQRRRMLKSARIAMVNAQQMTMPFVKDYAVMEDVIRKIEDLLGIKQ